jgi:hypothetical protein
VRLGVSSTQNRKQRFFMRSERLTEKNIGKRERVNNISRDRERNGVMKA